MINTSKVKDELKAECPNTRFSVRRGTSAGAEYLTVTVRQAMFDLLEGGRNKWNFTLHGFENYSRSERWNNGAQLTPYGWALLSEVAELLVKYEGRNVFVSLVVDLEGNAPDAATYCWK